MGGARPPFFGPGRRMNTEGENQPADNLRPRFGGPRRRMNPEAEDDQGSTVRPLFFGPGRRPAQELNEESGTTRPERQGRRGRERTKDSQLEQPAKLQAPVIPPVPEPVKAKAKPVRSDSLLEAIIKLVNSILTFKGK